MARIKYYYDTESCKYERIRVSTGDIVWNALGFLVVSLLIGGGIAYGYLSHFESPELAKSKAENEELLYRYEILQQELGLVGEELGALQDRDDNLYRVIFGTDPVPTSIRKAGRGGSVRFQELIDEVKYNDELIVSTSSKIDEIKKKMYIQSKSYDEIAGLAKQKEKMWSCIPAIQPISNKELTRLASGFGPRIHPIYHVRKMHTGIDLTAKRGTPIYATGDGKVKLAETKFGGYGKQVEIDHGFGYVTKYAHMNRYIVRTGQNVKRGEIIGYVGTTGTSTAPHLHYEVIYKGEKVDPIHYFFNDLTPEQYEEILELASRDTQSLS